MQITRDCRANLRREIVVALPEITQASCVGESRATAGTPAWCKAALEGDSAYWVREFDPFSHVLRRSLSVQLSAGRALVNLDGRSVELGDAPLRALFEPVWSMPSEAVESCRDGALSVVEAKREGAWKVVLRHCHYVVDIRQLEGLLSAATGPPHPSVEP